MTAEEFQVQFKYYVDKLGISFKDLSRKFLVAQGTATRWYNKHSAPAEVGRDSIIEQLRAMETITKETLNENIIKFLKDNLRVRVVELPVSYYEGDSRSFEVKILLGDEVITSDWVSI